MLKVLSVPVLSDNYSYLLINEKEKIAAVVDGVDADKIIGIARENQVTISCILTTHSHWDHDGGNERLLELLGSSIPVYGGKGDNVCGVSNELSHGDTLQLGELEIKALYTSCHSPGHVMYLCQDTLFTGDIMFVAGCGRFNQGSPEQMHLALNTYIAELPLTTRIYCGHEYTVQNLKFALEIEPDNKDIVEKLEWAMKQTENKKECIPTTVEDELKTNPFMRVNQASIQSAVQLDDPIQVLAELRKRKDRFGLGSGK